MQLNEGELITCPLCKYVGAVDFSFKRIDLSAKFICPRCKGSFIAFRDLRTFAIRYLVPSKGKLDKPSTWKQIFVSNPIILRQRRSSKI
jgi:hypothetical protein